MGLKRYRPRIHRGVHIHVLANTLILVWKKLH